MSLAKRTRFILIQSTSNANVTEYNMEPYHTSIFHRSTSMPPLPKLRSLKKIDLTQEEQSLIFPVVICVKGRRSCHLRNSSRFKKESL